MLGIERRIDFFFEPQVLFLACFEFNFELPGDNLLLIIGLLHFLQLGLHLLDLAEKLFDLTPLMNGRVGVGLLLVFLGLRRGVQPIDPNTLHELHLVIAVEALHDHLDELGAVGPLDRQPEHL